MKPAEGGSFIRNKDGSLTKVIEAPETPATPEVESSPAEGPKADKKDK